MNINISKKLQILSAIICGQISMSQAQQMDLNYVIQYALRHNYDYKKAQLDKSISYEKTFEILTAGFPKVNGSLGYQNLFIPNTSVAKGENFGQPGRLVPLQFGIEHNVSTGINVQQLIFDGRYLVGVQAREAVKKLADAQVKMSERDVKVLVTNSFYQAVVAEHSIAQLQSSRDVLERLHSDAQKVYSQGLIEELDVERLQYNVKTLDNTINTLKTQAEIALLALKLNMGFPLDENLKLFYKLDAFDTKISDIKNVNVLSNIHYENREEINILDQAIKLKKYDLKQTKAGYLPSVYGAFNYGFQSMRTQFDFLSSADWYKYGNFGLQINVPIFDGFTRKSQVKQLNLGIEKLNIEKEQLANAMKLQAINARLSLQNSIDEYENQSNILKLAEKIEKKTQVKYKEGVGSSYEFATAQNDRIQQYLKLLQSQLNVLMKFTEYNKASGNL